jgi:hypothetical protein
VDGVARRLEHREEGRADVLHVHQRPPRRAVALDEDVAGEMGVADEVVDHEVGAEAGETP